MRILGCRISDDDGSMVVDWYEEREQKPEGGSTYSTVITREALDRWQHVGYYGAEVKEDLVELINWFRKYETGVVE